MLWVVVFALPVVKMALLGLLAWYAWRNDRDPGEPVDVSVGLGPDRPRAPGAGGRADGKQSRGGPGRRAVRRRPGVRA